MAREEKTKERTRMTEICRWCKKTVDPEECMAEPIIGGDKIVWLCQCGEIVTDPDEPLSASSS